MAGPENDTTEPLANRKAVLFCPDCGHASGIDGDWFTVDDEAGTLYVCPDCVAVVTTRPRSIAACSR